MSRRIVAMIAALAAFAALAFAPSSQALTQDRYLDEVKPGQGGIRLVIFHPEIFNIQALKTLKEAGIFDVPGLTVIGIYHYRQTDTFEASHAYVERNGLDWFKFHEVTADIEQTDIFKENACLPEFKALLLKSDGIIFFGGPDAPASTYGEKTSLLTQIDDPYRHYFEASAAFHLLGGSQNPSSKPMLISRPDFPVLGICLGLQSMNIGTGGTLVQDIWSEVYDCHSVEEVIALGSEQWHTNPFARLYPFRDQMRYNFHTIELAPDGLFCSQMGFEPADHPRVLSAHHQAIEKLGSGLKPIAWSRDRKIIEAIAHTKFHNVLAVQFHPEHYLLLDDKPFVRQKPGEPLTSYQAILAGTPPSIRFNQEIWHWLARKLKESHNSFESKK